MFVGQTTKKKKRSFCEIKQEIKIQNKVYTEKLEV